MLFASVLTSTLSAQAVRLPISLPGPILLGQTYGGGGGGDVAANLANHTCNASMTIDPSGAPLSVSRYKGPHIVFSVRSGNCGQLRPRGCTFKGSLRVNNNSAREIEVCPPGVQAGSPSCVKIPAGGFYRFTGINKTLSCDSNKNTEEMKISYFAGGQMNTGSIKFTCDPCN